MAIGEVDFEELKRLANAKLADDYALKTRSKLDEMPKLISDLKKLTISKPLKFYVVRNNKTGKFYRHSKHAGWRWVDDLKDAKLFNGLNHAKNAVNLRIEEIGCGFRDRSGKKYPAPGEFDDISYLMAEVQVGDFKEVK